jgi:hypothetical protein
MPTMFKADQPTAKQLRAKAKRLDDAMAKFVRAVCVERDGYCALAQFAGIMGCYGNSEWCHHHDRMRSKTRGMAPEYRHSAAFSFMACRGHHLAYDEHVFEVTMLGGGGVSHVVVKAPKALRRLTA